MDTPVWIEFFAWIEGWSIGIWIRESLWTFPTLLVFHALGMAFLVGASLIINLRLIGLVPSLSLPPLAKLFPLITLSFTANLFSGLLLLMAYPAKGLTNPLFFIKLVLVITAISLTYRQRSIFTGEQTLSVVTKRLALTILLLWFLGIVSGRLLAYTHTWLLVS